jgi:hypothetical protein
MMPRMDGEPSVFLGLKTGKIRGFSAISREGSRDGKPFYIYMIIGIMH